jgi:AAA+ ATPase superfamily predicted ATPase
MGDGEVTYQMVSYRVVSYYLVSYKMVHYTMKSPFLFGRTVSSEGFTNRVKEIKRLKANFTHQVNTILISPRRWGKSSLVNKVSEEVSSRSVKIVHLDLLGIRSEEEFYKALATETIKTTGSKLSEWLQACKSFFRHITPKISVGADPLQDFEIGFEWSEIEKNYKEILQLPEKIAASKNIRIIICIDEFQNLAVFKEPLLFQKRLRSEWQHQQKVNYCLYGSQQHMMMELFERQSMPFFKFGDVMYLSKIDRKEWISFIVAKFRDTLKKIDESQADTIAKLVQDHSYYVQQLSHIVWLNTEKAVTGNIVESSLNDLLEQNSILYTRDTEELSANQLLYLKAISDGVHTGLSSMAVIEKYRLGTSANVLKVKQVLIKKELIEERAGGSYFLDPVYEIWFRKFIS